MVFSDSSSVAYAAVVYVIFKVPKDMASPWSSDLGCKDSFDARLLLSKARVAPLNGMTVPRAEMNRLILGT